MTTESLVGRAIVLRAVAVALTVPEPPALAELATLLEAVAGTDEAVEALREALAVAELGELAEEHDTLFGGPVRISPYETSYEIDPFRKQRQLADIAGFYRAFGADAHGAAAERPDHVGCELEFLAFLLLRHLEADADSDTEATERCAEAEASFLAEHLGRFGPTFMRELAASTAAPLYGFAAALGERAIVRELALRDIVPQPMPTHRSLPATGVEGDEIECG